MPQVNPYSFKSKEWYHWTHSEAQAMHEIFEMWLFDHMNRIKSVMEVGCGLHDFYEKLCMVNGIDYIGVDHDPEIIKQRNADGTRRRFVCADFCEWPLAGLNEPAIRADIVFSRAVIDHVARPDSFIQQALTLANKYVYIMTYRPCLPEAQDHAISDPDAFGYRYNDLSLPHLDRLLANYPHQLIRVPTGRAKDEIQEELHIIVEIPQ